MQSTEAQSGKRIEQARAHGLRMLPGHGSDKPNLKEYLLSGPKVESFAVNRDRDTGRTIRL
jgi:hypothetical protein